METKALLYWKANQKFPNRFSVDISFTLRTKTRGERDYSLVQFIADFLSSLLRFMENRLLNAFHNENVCGGKISKHNWKNSCFLVK